MFLIFLKYGGAEVNNGGARKMRPEGKLAWMEHLTRSYTPFAPTS